MTSPASGWRIVFLVFIAKCVSLCDGRDTTPSRVVDEERFYSADEIDVDLIPQKAEEVAARSQRPELLERQSEERMSETVPLNSQGVLGSSESDDVHLLLITCNQSFVPFSYPTTHIGGPILSLTESTSLNVWCLLSESWAPDSNGTACHELLQEAAIHTTSPVRLVKAKALSTNYRHHFHGVVASACGLHHAIGDSPWSFITSLLRPAGLVQVTTLGTVPQRLPETRAVFNTLVQAYESSSPDLSHTSRIQIAEAVLSVFGHHLTSDYPNQLHKTAQDTLLHAPLHLAQLSLDELFNQAHCAGLIPVSVENEGQYHLSISPEVTAESTILKATQQLPWEQRVSLADMMQGSISSHTLHARVAPPSSRKCPPNEPESSHNVKTLEQELAADYPMYPAKLQRNNSAGLVSAFPLAELDHNVWGGELELSAESLRVLAVGSSCMDFATSVALQLMLAVGTSHSFKKSSVVLLDDDHSGKSRELVESRIQTLGLTNLQVISKGSPEGIAALRLQYHFVHVGELLAEDAANTLQLARKLATHGVGLFMRGIVRQQWRAELHKALHILSRVTPMQEGKDRLQVAAELLTHMSQDHIDSKRYASINTAATLAQATSGNRGGMNVSQVYNVARQAGLQVAAFRDQFLYESSLASLEAALTSANATYVLDILATAPRALLLTLGELLNPDGIAQHSIYLIPDTATWRDLTTHWEMEAIPLAMPAIKPGELATALESLTSRARVTCHSQGMNGTLVLPELSGQILKHLDGHRSVGTIYRLFKAQLPKASFELFREQFSALVHTLYSCNSLYLTYGQSKYQNLYDSGLGGASRKQNHGSTCNSKRCKLRRQKAEQARQVEDFAWRQELVLNMGLHLMNVDGYQKGTQVL